MVLGAALREGLAPEPSTALNDESPPSSPEKKHKHFGFLFLGGKKKKSSTTDLTTESTMMPAEGAAAAAGSKTSLDEPEEPLVEDPIFKLLNEGAAKRNYDRKLSKQKTISSECMDD